jgi:hypothetical protein
MIDAAHDTRLAGGAISFAGLADPAQLTTGQALAQEDR